jgi:hypothetical protein
VLSLHASLYSFGGKMARQGLREAMQAAEDELLDYLRDNGEVEYKDLHNNVSGNAIQQYRRLKQAGVIKSSVRPSRDGNSHRVWLAESERE